ncbi:MAG TPA: DAK2 domain-containing protein [Solirubrobacteraceae bacterium]|nr:DAK2 domain-containing protein [Solirubrobacteraceae bacterium]
MSDSDLARFRAAVAGGLAHLESRRQEVNDLNVFPVADGDTGDNMALTLRAVLAELDRLQEIHGEKAIDEIGRAEIVESVARAALLGARGNSGVILSQLIRGAAEELVSRPGELVDATLIGAAIANASDKAYSSVREPAEGTILTVAREMARMIASDVAHATASPRLGPQTSAEAQDKVIADTLARGVVAGEEAVKRGPELLAALREAGVVDAGGYGLTVIFAGVVAALRGQEPPELEHHAPARISHPQHISGTYRYCTNFAVTGVDLRPAAFIAPLEAIGDSVLVVGDSATLKVHVHTDEPELAAAVFDDAGEVSHFDVADMRIQVAERDERLAGQEHTEQQMPLPTFVGNGNGATAPAAAGSTRMRCGALAVTAGAGLTQLFAELGAHVIDGGPTLNPSTYELLAGIHEIEAEEVVVLPGSRNVVMAAERAAELSDKQVLVVRALSQQAALAAAVALMPERGVNENAQAMDAAIERVRIGAVAPAARDDAQGRFQRGQAVGFLDGEVVAWGEPQATLLAVVEHLAQEAELISVLFGKGAPLRASEVEAMIDGSIEAELELREGGQPAYWWLLSAE